MPEFILPMGAKIHRSIKRTRWDTCDDFTKGYIEAMFFTDTGTGDDAELEDATVSDLARDAWTSIKADCKAFQKEAKKLLKLAYATNDYDAEQAGRDFWFTRNGHGVGYWDREVLEKVAVTDRTSGVTFSLATRLSNMADGWGNIDLYRGDNGKVYVS